MMPNIHDARLAPARNCSRLRSARSTATCVRSSASCWLRDNERAKRRSRGNKATMRSPISSAYFSHAFMTNNTTGTCDFFHAQRHAPKFLRLFALGIALAGPAGSAQLPQVQLPQVPGVPVPALPDATRAAGGTLRELAGARALRVEQLVRQHRAELDRDPRGELVVRAEVVAIDITAAALEQRAAGAIPGAAHRRSRRPRREDHRAADARGHERQPRTEETAQARSRGHLRLQSCVSRERRESGGHGPAGAGRGRTGGRAAAPCASDSSMAASMPTMSRCAPTSSTQ